MNTNAAVVAPQNTIVKIIANDKSTPPGKPADAEITSSTASSPASS